MLELATKGSKAQWTTVAFGDVVRQVKDKIDPEESGLQYYVAGDHMDTDDLRIRRFGVIGDGYLGPAFHMRFKPGHVLYGSRRTYLRKVAVADFEGVTANTTYVLESSDPEALLPDLLPFIMQTESFTQHSVRESKGSVNPYVNFSDLAWFEFALPPIEEQKRTARLLMAARAAHEGLLEVVERGETLRDAWITRLIEFGTSGETRRETDMGRFPAAWDTQPLGERYDIQLGKMMSPKARSGDAQVPYMRNANVQWGRLDLSDVATMSIAEAERERFGLRPGDILACEGRHVGKSVIWNDEIPGACYQKALHRLRPRNSATDLPEFMLLCLRLYSVSGRFIQATGETTIPHLPAERFREIVFPFPPEFEQREICDRVAQLDRQLAEARKRADAAKRVVRSLISEAVG
jgi:type I restriction enzyme S subunit